MVSSINHINFSRSIQYYHFKAKATNFSRFGYFIFLDVEMYGLVYMKLIRLMDQTCSGLDAKIQFTETSLSPTQVRLQTTASVLRLILLDSGSRKDVIKCLVLSAKKTWVSFFEFNSFSVNLRCAYREKCRRLLSKYYVAIICDSIVKHSDIVYFQILFLKLSTKN